MTTGQPSGTRSSSSEPVRLALIGFGWFAELLTSRVLADVPGLRVVGAVDPSPHRRERARELGLAAAPTVGALLAGPLPSGDDTGIEAVAVLTPHDTHRAVVLDAVARGLHVFCEKAFAVGSADCLDMIEAARAARVTLAVGHMQKLFPAHRRVVELARSGVYGPVASVQVDGYHWCPVLPGWWRSTASCGGLLYWTGIHDLDTMRAIVGAEAETVYAVAGPRLDDYTEHEDTVAVTITYTNGAVGTLQVAEQHPVRAFEDSFDVAVLLASGGVRMHPGSGRLEHAGRTAQSRGEVHVEEWGSFASQEVIAYREELTRFADVVRGAQPPDGSLLDGLRCVETLEAVYRSIASRQPEAVTRHLVQEVGR